MTLELPFAYTSYITPHFRPHEPRLHILALETKSESLFEIFESREDFVWVSKNLHLIETCEVWKLSKVIKFKLLTPFQDTKAFFHQTYNFSFIEPHETNFFIMDFDNLSSIKSHEIHLEIKWYLFLHDLEWKSL